jgi:hypothetical protein
MSLRRIVIAVVVLALPVIVAAGEGDEAEEAPTGQAAVIAGCEKALAAARAGDWRGVVAASQRAIDEAQKMMQRGMEAVFPKAPEGWTAEKIVANRMAMGSGGEAFSGIHLQRKYKHVESGVVIEVLLTDMSMLVQMHKARLAMRENEQVARMMGIEFFEKDGHACWRMEPPEGSQAQVVAFGEKRILSFEGPKGSLEKIQSIFDLFSLEDALE